MLYCGYNEVFCGWIRSGLGGEGRTANPPGGLESLFRSAAAGLAAGGDAFAAGSGVRGEIICQTAVISTQHAAMINALASSKMPKEALDFFRAVRGRWLSVLSVSPQADAADGEAIVALLSERS